MPTITKLGQYTAAPAPMKRVAAYARVSVATTELMNSLANQVDYYSTYIQNHPGWQYAGVYVDAGITGTSTTKRAEFRRLIQDCEAGKIDLVLVKSISRFARNTVDLLNTTRHLKELGIAVQFDEQNINTMSAQGELLLTLMAAVAQSYSENLSQNILWSIAKRFNEGIPNGYKRTLGYDWNGEQYVVVPEEAEIIKKIFTMYLDGRTSVQIAKELNAANYMNILGNPFTSNNIRIILDNPNYTGDLLLQKRCSLSIGKSVVNKGQMPMYLVEDDHTPIIDHSTFQQVQELRKARVDAQTPKQISPFSGLLKCGYCGAAVCRRGVHNRRDRLKWKCNAIDKHGKTACQASRHIPEQELINIVTEILGYPYELKLQTDIRRINVFDDKLEFLMSKGQTRTVKRVYDGKSCFLGKMFCGHCHSPLERRTRKEHTWWRCKSCKDDTHNIFSTVRIQESELFTLASYLLGAKEDIAMTCYLELDKIFLFPDHLTFYTKEGEVQECQRP